MTPPDPNVVDDLVRWMASWSGYSPDAIRREALERLIQSFEESGVSVERLRSRAASGDPELVQAVVEAVSVGETSFFRQQEHFRWLAKHADRWPHDVVRVWSAGCATGEEAYSLGACLVGILGPTRVDVLGTDLVAANVERARRGIFGRWSMRGHSPSDLPFLQGVRGSRPPPLFSVDDVLRGCVRFEQHNLLDEPPPSQAGFHVVVCRNVLLYFSNDSAKVAARRLASALAATGVLILGALDVSQPPPGLRRLAPAHLNVFERIPETERPGARTSLRPSVPVQPWRPESWEAAIALHLRALTFIERGQSARAEDILESLRQSTPDYLPGLLEHALLFARGGDRPRAAEAMRELSRRCLHIADDAVVPGPEDLPIEYYRAVSRTYLEQTGDGR